MFGPGLPDADGLLCGGPQLTPSGHQGGPDTRGAHVHPNIKLFHAEAGLSEKMKEEGSNSLTSAPRPSRKFVKTRKDVSSSPLNSPAVKISAGSETCLCTAQTESAPNFETKDRRSDGTRKRPKRILSPFFFFGSSAQQKNSFDNEDTLKSR